MLDVLDADTYAFWTGFTGAPGTASGVDAGASWYRTGIPSTNYNGILGASADANIDALIERARAWGIPSRWMLSSGSMPQGFDRALEHRGLTLFDEAPGMVARIAELRKPGADALSVEIVRNADQFAEWIDVFFVDALGLPSELAAHARAAHDHARVHDPRRTYLLMRNEGAAVATGLLHASAPGIAGIYGIGVRRAFQKRGLGALATCLTCDAGARAGAEVAVLQATKAGFPVYEKLGFGTVTSYRSWRLS
jgi:hypothetical protein